MGLEKAIEHGKEHRRKYRGAKAIDPACRNHGNRKGNECPWCKGNRTHKNDVSDERTRLELENTEFDFGHDVKYYTEED